MRPTTGFFSMLKCKMITCLQKTFEGMAYVCRKKMLGPPKGRLVTGHGPFKFLHSSRMEFPNFLLLRGLHGKNS